MPLAYILFNIETGKMAPAMKALEEVPEVKEFHSLYGEYDIICKVEASTTKELSDLTSKINRTVKNVTASKTLIVS